MKKALATLLVLAAIGSGVAAWADDGGSQNNGPGRGGHGEGRDGMGHMMMVSLSMAVTPPQISAIENLSDSATLSENQLTRLDSVLTKSKSNLSDLQKKSSEATKALRSALTASKYDASNVKALAVKAEKAEADVVSASISTWSKIFDILTADQAAKLRDSMSKQQPGQGPRPSMQGDSAWKPGGMPPSGDVPGGNPPSGDMPGGNPPSGDAPGGNDAGTPPAPGQ